MDVIRKEKGTVILLGATDAGKTALAKFLIAQLSVKKIKVAFVELNDLLAYSSRILAQNIQALLG